MKKAYYTVLTVLLVGVFSVLTLPQSGGTFVIQKSVIAGGGGNSAGGTFNLDGTIGQPFAGETSAGGTFSVGGGFWSADAVASGSPTPTPGPAISGTVTYGNAIPAATRFVSNVLISAAGSPNASTTTGIGTGTYSLTGFGSGAYTVTPSKPGGPNGFITSFDAARIAQHVAGSIILTGNTLAVADVSGGGGVSSFDAGLVARFVAALVPPPTNFTGTWRFLPVSRNYASIVSNIAGEDYSALLMGEVSGNWLDNGTRPAERGPERNTTVIAPKVIAPADSEIIVPINVEGAADKGIIAYEFDLRYDPSVIQPEANPVDMLGTASRRLAAVVNAEQPGLLRVVVYGPMPINSNGVLMKLRFAGVGAPGSISPLTWQRIMLNEGDPKASVSNGQVELSASAQSGTEIGGRLLTTMGQGVPNARVTLTDTAGQSRSVVSNGFGIYRFANVQVGQTYTISVEAQRFTFTPLTVSVTDQLVTVDIIAKQ